MKIVSVTRVLGAFSDFSAIPAHVLQAAAERGTLVHDICERYVLGKLFMPSLIPAHVLGYFNSFKIWFDQYVDRVFFVEQTFEDPVYGFRGRIDLGCSIRGEGVFVVDYKTPILEGSGWCGQLAAYRHLWRLGSPELDIKGMSLRLDAAGKPARAIRYEYSDDDFSAFLNALVAYRYFT